MSESSNALLPVLIPAAIHRKIAHAGAVIGLANAPDKFATVILTGATDDARNLMELLETVADHYAPGNGKDGKEGGA